MESVQSGEVSPPGQPALNAERALAVVGVLLLLEAAVHYGDAILALTRPGYATQPGPHYVARLACLCTFSGVLLGVALIRRHHVVATYGLVLWAIYPLQAMVNDLLDPKLGWDILYKGPRLSMVAPFLVLAAGLLDKRHILLAVGLSMIGFWAKGMINQIFGAPEAQIVLVNALGERNFVELFSTLNWVALALGVPLTVTGWVVYRRLSRQG